MMTDGEDDGGIVCVGRVDRKHKLTAAAAAAAAAVKMSRWRQLRGGDVAAAAGSVRIHSSAAERLSLALCWAEVRSQRDLPCQIGVPFSAYILFNDNGY